VYMAVGAVNFPLSQSLVVENTTPGNSNLVMGFYTSVNSAAMVIGSLAGGFMYDLNPRAPMIFSVIMLTTGIVFMNWYRRLREKQEVI